MGGVKWNPAQFERLVRGLRRTAGVPQRTAELAAPDITAAAASAFDAGQTPYGEAWPPTKTQGARRLNDTGALRAAATTYTPSGRRLKSGGLPKYGRFQNPRLFLPKRSDLPASWRAVIDKWVPKAIQDRVLGR